MSKIVYIEMLQGFCWAPRKMLKSYKNVILHFF